MYFRIGKGGKTYWGKSGAGILYTDGHQMLLLLRGPGSSDHADTWDIPGGSGEDNETAIDTARRESLEEVGYFGGQRIGTFETKDGHHVFTTFIFKIKEPFLPVFKDTEHTDFAWVPLENVKELPLIPPLKKAFSHYMHYIKQKFSRNFQDWVEWKESYCPDCKEILCE